jgi:transcriptional regulator with XRE-family HTH domain
MRRTSLTQNQAWQLARILKPRRLELHYSIRDVAHRAGVNKDSVATLENGTNLTPQPETLKAIAQALELSVTDLMLIADWLPAGELPNIQPYLRAKYGLSRREAGELDDYLAKLQRRHGSQGGTGPSDHEDEH